MIQNTVKMANCWCVTQLVCVVITSSVKNRTRGHQLHSGQKRDDIEGGGGENYQNYKGGGMEPAQKKYHYCDRQRVYEHIKKKKKA